MTLKQETLSWLTDLLDESPKWKELHDEIQMVRSLDDAEADIRAGRVHSTEEVRRVMQAKWAHRDSK
jgi:hypothetical protein